MTATGTYSRAELDAFMSTLTQLMREPRFRRVVTAGIASADSISLRVNGSLAGFVDAAVDAGVPRDVLRVLPTPGGIAARAE